MSILTEDAQLLNACEQNIEEIPRKDFLEKLRAKYANDAVALQQLDLYDGHSEYTILKQALRLAYLNGNDEQVNQIEEQMERFSTLLNSKGTDTPEEASTQTSEPMAHLQDTLNNLSQKIQQALVDNDLEEYEALTRQYERYETLLTFNRF